MLEDTWSKDATNVAPGLTTSNKKLLGAKGIATRSKKLLVAPGITTSNKKPQQEMGSTHLLYFL